MQKKYFLHIVHCCSHLNLLVSVVYLLTDKVCWYILVFNTVIANLMLSKRFPNVSTRTIFVNKEKIRNISQLQKISELTKRILWNQTRTHKSVFLALLLNIVSVVKGSGRQPIFFKLKNMFPNIAYSVLIIWCRVSWR